MNFQLILKTKMLKNIVLFFQFSDVVFIKLINVKIPTIVCILTFMRMINFMLKCVEHENGSIASGAWYININQSACSVFFLTEASVGA